jgi:hypothetical protein
MDKERAIQVERGRRDLLVEDSEGRRHIVA